MLLSPLQSQISLAMCGLFGRAVEKSTSFSGGVSYLAVIFRIALVNWIRCIELGIFFMSSRCLAL